MFMVEFTSSEGRAGQHRSDSLEEAIKFIEHARNYEGVGETKLYQLTEIPLEVKAVYKVELATGMASSAPEGSPEAKEAAPAVAAAES